MRVLELLEARRTAKAYNGEKISKEDFEKILDMLVLSPTSVNLQAGRFMWGSSPEAWRKFSEALHPANVERLAGASHFILFCRPLDVDEEHYGRVLSAEVESGRVSEEAAASGRADASRRSYAALHEDKGDLAAWTAHQLYIALGVLLVGVEDMGIAATAVEGLHPEKVDETFGLAEMGLACEFAAAVGFRDENRDSNFKKPKSRISAALRTGSLD